MEHTTPNKKCECCGQLFNCNVHAIETCFCNAIQLTIEAKLTIAQNFTNCLCKDCLTDFNAHSK